MLKDTKLESANTEDTTLLSPLQSIAMEKRSQSTSIEEANARLSHRPTLASAFANMPCALGSWDRRIGPVGPCTSAYRKSRRNLDKQRFLTIIDKRTNSTLSVGKGRNSREGENFRGTSSKRGILTLRSCRLERVRNAINVVGPGTSFAILACVGFSIFLVS